MHKDSKEREMVWSRGGRFTASIIGEQSVITGGCQQEELDLNSIEQLLIPKQLCFTDKSQGEKPMSSCSLLQIYSRTNVS